MRRCNHGPSHRAGRFLPALDYVKQEAPTSLARHMFLHVVQTLERFEPGPAVAGKNEGDRRMQPCANPV